MKTALFSYIRTKQDGLYLREQLTELARDLYNISIPFDSRVHELFSFEFAEKLLAEAREQGVVLTDPQGISAFLDTLEGELQTLPTVTLRLAFEPQYDLVKNISKWFDAELRSHVLLEVIVDPTVIGGLIVEWNGAHRDYTLKKIIQEKLEKGKGVGVQRFE